jgi:hypothetical protein
MTRRRAAEAGFKPKLGFHVFRTTGITTAYLEADGTLENARVMAAHGHARQSSTIDAKRSRSMRPSESLFEDGQRRLRGAGRRSVSGDRRPAFIRPQHYPIHRLNSFCFRLT